jgi:hypothetical protein
LHGPWVKEGGGGVRFAYGFEVELGEGKAVVRFGDDELTGRVGVAGRSVSVVVPRVELDRPPGNFPRPPPPFPYRAFSFEARVLSPRDELHGQEADFWPQERTGSAGYLDGQLCAPPCLDARLGL